MAGQEDRVCMAVQKGWDGACENCRECKVQVAQGLLSVGSAHPRRLPVPHCFSLHRLTPVPVP